MHKSFRQLAFADRELIQKRLEQGCSKSQIATELSLSLSGLYRELARFDAGVSYDAAAAQKDFERKRQARHLPSTLSRYPGMAGYLAEQLLVHDQSPTAVARDINAGKTPFPPNSISVSTIYNHLRSGTISQTNPDT